MTTLEALQKHFYVATVGDLLMEADLMDETGGEHLANALRTASGQVDVQVPSRTMIDIVSMIVRTGRINCIIVCRDEHMRNKIIESVLSNIYLLHGKTAQEHRHYS